MVRAFWLKRVSAQMAALKSLHRGYFLVQSSKNILKVGAVTVGTFRELAVWVHSSSHCRFITPALSDYFSLS